jgi:hypothetical protein
MKTQHVEVAVAAILAASILPLIIPGGHSGAYFYDTEIAYKNISAWTDNATVPPPPPGPEEQPGKVVNAWGTISGSQGYALFSIWAYHAFLPNGKMDYRGDREIIASQIDSVTTNDSTTPKTGTVKGVATVDGSGSYGFTVKVTDGGQPPSPYVGMDTFSIDVPGIAYHNDGLLTGGDIQVIK